MGRRQRTKGVRKRVAEEEREKLWMIIRDISSKMEKELMAISPLRDLPPSLMVKRTTLPL